MTLQECTTATIRALDCAHVAGVPLRFRLLYRVEREWRSVLLAGDGTRLLLQSPEDVGAVVTSARQKARPN